MLFYHIELMYEMNLTVTIYNLSEIIIKVHKFVKYSCSFCHFSDCYE